MSNKFKGPLTVLMVSSLAIVPAATIAYVATADAAFAKSDKAGGNGNGKGLTRRGRKKGVSNLHKSSNIRAATTISAARAEFEAGVPMPANGAVSKTTAKAQTKKNSPITTVALTHNATDLVGKRMKRQSGDDHDSSDEGVVVAKARR